MTAYRIEKHPILPIPFREEIPFFWKEQELTAYKGETIASALFSHGIRIFGHHHKDGSPQGIFCANGQCAQCMVLAGGRPVKSCIELVQPGMAVSPVEGFPELPVVSELPGLDPIEELSVPVLIIGGGPAGMSAAIELGKLGIQALLVDDKHRLGGKLVLQTHRFFGSTKAVYAGTRGIDIAAKLEKVVRSFSCVDVWLHSTALAVFSDQKVGILKDGSQYVLVTPQVLLVASGAREKFLAFPGNTLPGVYGAGAFQTLVNRDLVRPAERLFIVGGGNVGLIAGYHALQAGIEVVGLVEVLPECGGYRVHKDKLARMGVPIYTSHTILSADGSEAVESVTIARVNEKFQPVPGSEKSFACDSVLIAVGLDPVDEFYQKARQFGMTAFAAGDAEEIAEASAAMVSGKIKGLEIARTLGSGEVVVPEEWYHTAEILKSKPGDLQVQDLVEFSGGAGPVIHCTQEIPCNPCAAVCPQKLIQIDPEDIRKIPVYLGSSQSCKVCMICVAKCPGLAITLVDDRAADLEPIVSIPYEYTDDLLQEGDLVTVLDTTGQPLGKLPVFQVATLPKGDRTRLLKVRAPREIASQIAGIQIQDQELVQPLDRYVRRIKDDTIICRCERVTAGEIRARIRLGYRDMNELKAITRAGMGSCGSKTCRSLILRLFREEGVPGWEVTEMTRRPLFVEVPLGVFAGAKSHE
ncbi:MAG TPA: FAD-dependent oxidoreductase [Anaerolineaceae bacterium]|nr:FAD-dependent oxidoreductase [Anaerolineaceae bacterium]